MLSVIRVHLPSEVPIVGCELTPYVLLRRPDNTATTDDVPESSPLDGHFLKYRWYRVQSDKKVAICSVHPSKEATLQCLGCIKTKVPVTKSYHCSTKCFTDAWQHHRVLHERAAAEGNGEEEELLRLNSSGSVSSILSTVSSLTNGSSSSVYPSSISQKTGAGGETLVEVGRSKTYTPMADDVGHVLKFECVVVNAETKQNVGHSCTILTSRVIPAPSPSPRVRCEAMNMSGSFFRNKLFVLSYLRKKFMSNPKRGGPEHNRSPSKMFFKAVRGMMPHRTSRGKAALARLYVYEGVPPTLQYKKKMVVPNALKALRLRPRSKFCVLGDLARETGWKRSEVLNKLETQRKVRSVRWYNQRKAWRKLDAKARADPSVKNSEANNILRSYGY